MILCELLDQFDGNTAISISCCDMEIYTEQGLTDILDDVFFFCYADMDVRSFGIQMSETSDKAPILYITLRSDSVNENDNISEYIRSPWSMLTHIQKSGLVVEKKIGMSNSDNSVRLPDKTTFNWKNRNRVVRVNCKEPTMRVIEDSTGLRHVLNGTGDPARPYSFLISTYSGFESCLTALKKIEVNVTG